MRGRANSGADSGGTAWLGSPGLLLAALALACAGGGAGTGAGTEVAGFPRAADRCVLKRSISSYRPIDARRLKLFADREYVVELMTRCSSLPLTEELDFLSRDEQLCDFRQDRIKTDSESCAIGAIRTVEEVEASTPR